MAKLSVPFLVAVKRGDRTWHYWQPSTPLRKAGWEPRRLPDDLAAAVEEAQAINAKLDAWRQGQLPAGGAAATESVRREKRKPGQAKPGTVDALIEAYKRSEFWARLSPMSHRSYEQAFERLSEWCGDIQCRAIEPPRVQKFYSAMAKKRPAFAAAIVRVGQLLWSRGRLLGLTGDKNPFAKQALQGGGKTGIAWPQEAVDLFVATADAMGRQSIGTAVLINSWLGQRQADILKLPRQVLRAGGIAFRQRKTGAVARLPINVVPQLVARIEAQIADVDRRAQERADARYGRRRDAALVVQTALLLDETTGRPWNEHTFRHVFAEVRAAADAKREGRTFEIDWLRAGKDQLDAHAYQLGMGEVQFAHLRHTAVVRLNEAGCDIMTISAITGHSPKTCEQILEIYGIKTGRAAAEGFKRRLAHEAAAKDDAE